MAEAESGYKTQITLQSVDRRIMLNVRADDITECMRRLQDGFGEDLANNVENEIRLSVNGGVSEQQAQQNLAAAGIQPAGPPQQQPQVQPQAAPAQSAAPAGNPKGYMEPCATCGTPKSIVQSGKWGPFANCPNWPSHKGKV